MKKNLVSVLKKLVLSFGGEAKGNNAVDLVDEFADVATQSGNSGPVAEWGEVTDILDNQKVKIIALGSEDDQSITFLKKVAENTMATLSQSQGEAILNAGILATIGKKSVTYSAQDPSKFVMFSEELIEQTGVEGYIISNTFGIRLYLSIELNDQGEPTNLRLSLVDAEALQDVDTPVTVTTVPTLIGVSGPWSYSYRILTEDEATLYNLQTYATAVIKFQPLKFRNAELSLIALAQKRTYTSDNTVTYYALTPFYGSDIMAVSNELNGHFIRAFRNLQSLKTLEDHQIPSELKLFDDHYIYTLSL